MKRKAQGMPLNVIIIAALALLVLVVLTIVFLGKMGSTSKTINSCTDKGGKCAEECGEVDAGTKDYPTPYPAWKCEVEEGEAPEKCCIQIEA